MSNTFTASQYRDSLRALSLESRRQAADELAELIVTEGTRTMDISPAMAAEMLDLAAPNRDVSERAVKRWAEDMTAGLWLMNGETIKFDADGKLIDGQHRLLAVLKSGVTIRSAIVFGIPLNAMPTIDVGVKRQLHHALGIVGEENGRIVAPALVLLHRHLNGTLGVASGSWDGRPSHSQAMDLLSTHPGIRESANAVPPKAKRLMTPSIATFCHYLFNRQSKRACENFFRSISEGIGLDSESPVYHLRNILLENSASKTKRRQEDLLALIFKAWIAFRDQKPMRLLIWRGRGPKPEAFPNIDAKKE